MSILGIDIGSDTIKVVEMAKAKGGYRLLNYGIAPTPPDSVVDGDVRDPEMVAEALKQLLKTHKIKSNRCVASVQGSKSTVVRIIELPRVSKNELAETMKFEVERHIPFAASQIIMDYAVVDRPGEPLDAPNMEVLFAAVQEEVVELLCDTLRRSKLKPRAIDVQPLALSRSLVETTSAGHGIGETVAVINMGATITELSIVRDGLLHFPRAIPIAGRSISQRLSEGLGISEQQAERQKREYATVRPLPPGAAPAVPEPEAEEEPTVDVADVALGYDVFETDSGEESDVGFGGTGTGESGFSFEETDAAEVQTQEPAGSSAFELSDEGDSEGPSFDFGFDDDSKGPSYSLSPKDEDEDDPEAPVPDDEIVFSFGDDTEEAAPELVVEEATEDEGFSFGPVAAADDEGFSFAAEPAAAEAGAADEGFSFAAEPVAAEGAEGESFTFGETAESTEPVSAAPEIAAPVATEADAEVGAEAESFTFGETAPSEPVAAAAEEPEPAEAETSDGGFVFDLGTETDAPTATATGDEPAFDFDLGGAEKESSVPGLESQTGMPTDVGTSFDLGDIATSDSEEGFEFDLAGIGDDTAESSGFHFTSVGEAADTPAAPVAFGGVSGELAEGSEQTQVRQVIEPVIREIAGEISRSLDYYRSRYEGTVVDRAILVGGTARIDGLAEFLEEELGLPVDRGDPLATVTVSNSRLTDEDLRRDAPLLGVAVGLALRELM